MKNYVLCAMIAAGFANVALADTSTAAVTTATTATPAVTTQTTGTSSTAPAYQSQTTSSINIAPRDKLIVATVVTHWDPKASDSLSIQWTAPQGSYCQSSSFPITQGSNLNHDTYWAYRTVVHTTANGNTVTCQGHWTAQVVNGTGQVLASAGYDVVANNGMPAAPTVVPAASGTTTTTSSSVPVSATTPAQTTNS